MGHCAVCDTDVPDAEILDHLRLLHPDRYGDGPETWPDGKVVIIDTTLDPDDFSADPPGVGE